MKSIPRLTDLEIDIMKVLWNHERPITIQEISNQFESLSVASVTQAMKHLINKKAVKVQEHILVSNVYARAFVPCFTNEEYLAGEYKRLQKNILGRKTFSAIGAIAALFDNSGKDEIKAEDIDELQKIIDKRKNELK